MSFDKLRVRATRSRRLLDGLKRLRSLTTSIPLSPAMQERVKRLAHSS